MRQGDHVIVDKEIENKMILENEKIPFNVLKILRTMKKTEICECTIKTKKFLETETIMDTSNVNKDAETIILDVFHLFFTLSIYINTLD